MKKEGITVPVKVAMDIDHSTANACLKLVEMYVNSTGKNEVGTRLKSGELRFEYEPDGRL